MSLRSCYRVQVSRIMITSLAAARAISDRTSSASAPDEGTHSGSLLLMRNSRHHIHGSHLLYSGADWSLPPPRHRCYALLSSALSRLVLESSANSYQARQDGLW